MKQIPIRLGPLAVLLTVISICLTTLAILTFTTAQADMRLSERFADTVKERYTLEAEGQRFIAELNTKISEEGAAAAEEYRTEEGDYEEQIVLGESTLTIRFRLTEGGTEVSEWRMLRDWEEDPDLNFWDGL